MDIGRVGVWWSGRFEIDGRPELDVAAEIEALGYGALWSTGGIKPGLSSRFGRLLSSSSHLVVASGIVSVWTTPAAQLATAVGELDAQYPGRFVLGLGASHSAVVEGYRQPYSTVAGYLDQLDGLTTSAPSVSADRRVLAALGPKMLELAARRAAGAHPYLVPVEHTALARSVMGQGPLLAPELTVVLDTDPTRAREQARSFVGGYLALPNYAGNL
ncbi:MAG TPA: TIGR03620 family F420-dependent LLM class oxidoreductase, partial [Acidimicrobiales bacterium]|nr:TIGR03620 family F420-dependent LLM class oxidoreductase [Acidimicrobiales bacterium]